jgi:hypothetical protein
MEALLGEQSDVVTNAFFRWAPSLAILSMPGVCSPGTAFMKPMKLTMVVAQNKNNVHGLFTFLCRHY